MNPSTSGHFRWGGFRFDALGMGQPLRACSTNLKTPSECNAKIVFWNVIQAVLSAKISPTTSVLGQTKLSRLTGTFDQFKLTLFCSVVLFFCHRLNPFLNSLCPPVPSRLLRTERNVFSFSGHTLSDESFKNLS